LKNEDNKRLPAVNKGIVKILNILNYMGLKLNNSTIWKYFINGKLFYTINQYI